jgi:hypothetical protein
MTTESDEVASDGFPGSSFPVEGAARVLAVIQLSEDRCTDGMAVVGDIDHVPCAFPVLLAGADVDDGRAEVTGFSDPNARVADQTSGAPQHGQELWCR